ncbi:hypothetical protein QAD02_003783 [Eretmocerus hayati]|uniref:Uncharacterized protein n=1 Tax=Eretmocerus hayati TaxID=131215 RepID=A0ACC2NN57_9HYME|nr:hypothetical protein QAD02_003783 [Eretmocerus hayati]
MRPKAIYMVPYYLVGEVSCRLDRKHNYSYAELVNDLGNSITNIITRVLLRNSEVGLGSYKGHYPFFMSSGVEQGVIDFWTFFDDSKHGIKKVGSPPCIYLYATAKDNLKRELTVNDLCSGVADEVLQQRPATVKVDKSDCHNIQSKTPAVDDHDKKENLAKEMKSRIRAITAFAKPSNTSTDAQSTRNLSRKFDIDPDQIASMADSMQRAMKEVSRVKAEVPQNSPSECKTVFPKKAEPTCATSAADAEVIVVSDEKLHGAPTISAADCKTVAIKKEPLTSTRTPKTNDVILSGEKSLPESASTSSSDDEFESRSNGPLLFCSGNGKTLLIHRHRSLSSLKPDEDAPKHCVTALCVELCDYTVQFTDENEPKILGKGAYGKVYLGKYSGFDVAVKELENFRFEDTLDIFKEIAINDRARSPNVANLLAFNINEQPPMARLLLEYVDGAELREVLFDVKPDSPNLDSLEKRISTVKQLLAALQYLHACEPPIIHGDLEPDNIMITHDLRVKICDFGSSRYDGLPEQLDPVDLPNFTLATTIYSAPEILLYDQDITAKSDVWAASCVALEVFVRERSWPIGENPSKELMKKTMLRDRSLDYRCAPHQLYDFLEGGFQWRPQKRFSAEELSDHLQGITWSSTD